MEAKHVLLSISTASLLSAILIPSFTRSDRTEENNGRCRAQFNAAKAAGAKLPNIDVSGLRYSLVSGNRREQCASADGTFTWDPADNALSLFGPK